MDLFRSKRSEERYLDFCRHEKKVPASSTDLAIEGEPIEPTDNAPSSRTGLTLQPKKLCDQRALFNQNGSDFEAWRYKSSPGIPITIEQA